MRLLRFSLVALITIILAGSIVFVSLAQTKTRAKTALGPTDPLLNQGPKAEAAGDKVMVSTQLASATKAAIKVLRDGGNAVDAMVTAVFLQHVNDYYAVSQFGSMSAIYYEASKGKYYALSAISERPRADRGEHGDPSKVAIGGVVRGLEALAKRFGTKRKWASYLAPAIAQAEEGVLVTSLMYGNNFRVVEGRTMYSVINSKEAREFYMPDGHLIPVGYRWKMPKLAEHLRKVASKGADYLYSGEWGQKFVKEANKGGYRVTREDLAEYKPKWSEPVRFTYRGHKILGSPPPDTGGLVVGYNLNILENFDLKNSGKYSESPDTLEIMARAFGRVSKEVKGAIRDPLNFRIPSNLWLSKDYGKMGAEFVRNTMLLPDVDLAPAKQTTASLSQPQTPSFSSLREGNNVSLGSNHNVIVDAQGNWISLLHTVHGGAPGIFIDGVRAGGSQARAYTAGPGRRLVLPITSIMIEKDGRPWLAMGTPGSPPQPVTEVLVNILDFGMHPKDAADAPRFWAFREEGKIQIESRISEKVRKVMTSHGIKIEDLGPYNWHTGSMQIIWRDSTTGKLHGVTDHRRLGYAEGF